MKKELLGFITCLLIVSLILIVLFSADVLQFNDKKKSHFIVFAGGSEDHFFAQLIAKGALRAADDLNVDIELYWSNWDFKKMVVQFKQAIDQNPDGIAMMGHPGEEALGVLIDEAIRKGITVTSMNVHLPGIQEQYLDRGFGYAGQNLYQSGNDLAKTAINRFNINPGEKVIFFGTEAIPIRGERSAAARKVFEEYGLNIIYEEKVLFDDDQQGIQWQADLLRSLLAEHDDAVLIFDDIGVAASVQGLKEGDFGSDYIPLTGFDLSPTLLDDLKSGYIDLLSDQQPFLQGYLSVLQLALSHRWKFSGLDINTGSGVLTSNTVSEIEEFVRQGIR